MTIVQSKHTIVERKGIPEDAGWEVGEVNKTKHTKEIVAKEPISTYNACMFYQRKKRKNENESEGSKICVNILEFTEKSVGLVTI